MLTMGPVLFECTSTLDQTRAPANDLVIDASCVSGIQLVRLALPPPQRLDHVNWNPARCCCRRRPDPKAMPGILLRLKTCCCQGFTQLLHQLWTCQRLTAQKKKWSLTVLSRHQVRQQCCNRAQRQLCPAQDDGHALSEWVRLGLLDPHCHRPRVLNVIHRDIRDDRCWPGSNSLTSGAAISPDLRNPKNPTQHTVHNITWFGLEGSRFHTLRNCSSITGVIGSRVHFSKPACSRLVPRKARNRSGILSTLGSPPPHAIWRCRIADR